MSLKSFFFGKEYEPLTNADAVRIAIWECKKLCVSLISLKWLVNQGIG